MKRSGIVAVILSLFIVLGPASAAEARDTVHRGPFWSWTGPSNWDASYGKQGITVSSPSGSHVIDWGFSGIFCVPANSLQASANSFMAGQRQNLRRNGVRFTQVGRVRQVGSAYFRQTNRYSVQGNGGRFRGLAVFDYSFYDATYCHQSLRVMQAPSRGFAGSLRGLKRIYRSMAYFGPGAPEPPR
ncbi:MAG: hypothetical protein ACSLFI_10995 [Solirubrobacterales bacterium]